MNSIPSSSNISLIRDSVSSAIVTVEPIHALVGFIFNSSKESTTKVSETDTTPFSVFLSSILKPCLVLEFLLDIQLVFMEFLPSLKNKE